MKALQYAKQELKAARFPTISIYHVAGDYHLADADWTLLDDLSFKSNAAAAAARSKIIDKALKAINR